MTFHPAHPRTEHDTTTLAAVAIWLTSDWGYTWVGCKHGVPQSGVGPVRICVECFEKVVAARASGEVA